MPKNTAGAPAAPPEAVPANAACSATHDPTDADLPSQHSSPECCGDQLNSPLEPLRHFPFSGPAREQLAPGLRVTFHNPYAIYYMPQPDALVIVRVIHGARDIATMAERGGFA